MHSGNKRADRAPKVIRIEFGFVKFPIRFDAQRCQNRVRTHAVAILIKEAMDLGLLYAVIFPILTEAALKGKCNF